MGRHCFVADLRQGHLKILVPPITSLFNALESQAKSFPLNKELNLIRYLAFGICACSRGIWIHQHLRPFYFPYSHYTGRLVILGNHTTSSLNSGPSFRTSFSMRLLVRYLACLYTISTSVQCSGPFGLLAITNSAVKTTLRQVPMNAGTHRQLASFVWNICNLLRGPKRNEYRKVILPGRTSSLRLPAGRPRPRPIKAFAEGQRQAGEGHPGATPGDHRAAFLQSLKLDLSSC